MANEEKDPYGVKWKCSFCSSNNSDPFNLYVCITCGRKQAMISSSSDSKKSDGGVKLDQGKHQVGLVSKIFLFGLASVLTFGAKKYAAHNWRKGIAYSRLFDAMMRHMWAWWAGEENDPESGESHLDHAACCLMFLRELSQTRKDLDDRYSEMRIVPVPEGRQDG